MTAKEYFDKGYDCGEKGDHKGAIENYTKALEINPDDAVAYYNRGLAKYNLSDYHGAIADYDKVIEINPDDAVAYYNRGLAKYNLSDYHGAIADYDKAIEIKPDYAGAYNNRGIAKDDLSDYHEAIADYDKVLEINPDYTAAYNNRGVAKESLSDYDGAIADYDKALKINPNYELARNNRNKAYSKIKEKHKEAAEEYIKQKIDILNVLALVGEVEGREIAKYMLDAEDFFKETIEGKDEEKKENYGEIYIESLIIISKLHVKDENETETSVSYYTKKKEVAEKLFFESSHFRLYSINTSNDPEEGKTLFHYLFPKENISSQVEEFGAFAGCFTANNDSLNQFRLYGKTKDIEGTGVSIALNKNFFSKEIRTGVETISELKETTAESKDKKEENSPELLPLFRCIYIDPDTCKVISLGQKEEYVFYRDNKDKGKEDEEKVKNIYRDYKNKIDKTQEEIINELEKLKKRIEENHLDTDIVYKLLLNLRYLVKHVAFKEEQECRIIQIKKLEKDDKITEENNRLYIKYCTLNKNNVERICLGPKVEDIDKFKQRLAYSGFSGIECYKSTAPLA